MKAPCMCHYCQCVPCSLGHAYAPGLNQHAVLRAPSAEPPSPPSPPPTPPSPPSPPPSPSVTYSYVAVYSSTRYLSTLDYVIDLLDGLKYANTWGFQPEQVTLTRVTIGEADVLAAPGAQEAWEYMKQYPYTLPFGSTITFYFSVSLDAARTPPYEFTLYFNTATISVDRWYSGEHVRVCVRGWLRA